MDVDRMEIRKQRARAWFETLRDRLVEAFEALEDALPADAPLANKAAGRFVRTPWDRTDHTGKPGPTSVCASLRVLRSITATEPRIPAAATRLPSGEMATAIIGVGEASTSPRTSPFGDMK